MTQTFPEPQNAGLRMALAACLVAVPTLLAAQIQPPGPAPAVPQPPPIVEQFPPEQPRVDDFGVFRPTRTALRIGQDFSLAAGDAVRNVVVIFGNATIAGEVDDDVVVVLGGAKLASTAVVRGSFTSVGGNVTAESGVTVMRDFAVIGGTFNAPPDFSTGGEQVVIGGGFLGAWFQDLVPYLTRGLLWGRLIVPDLPWVWGVLALVFLVYLALGLLFDGPVRACTATLSVKPLTAFGVGLLVLLLIGPICLLLAVSVVGIAVIPFVFFALVGGWVIGRVAVARWIGMSVFAEESPENRAHALRSIVIGFVLISIAYMVPLLGIATWAITGVLGLGAATMAFIAAYRRENPKPIEPVPSSEVPPPPVPATYSGPDDSRPAPAPSPSASFSATERPPAMAFAAASAADSGASAAAIPLSTVSPSLLVTLPKALFRDRLAAFVLDIVLLAIVVNILRADPDEMFFPLLLAYHIAAWTWKQTTVGGIICQLRIVRTDGAPLTFADALVRGLAAVFSIAVFFIGALWILRDPDRQAWHDKIAGTYVVKVPRNLPL
jgi:uncharacterized RDD family membrane protein YckC